MEDPRLMLEISELTLRSLSGSLDESGLRHLEELLENHPIAVEYYQELVLTYVGLKSAEGISSLQEINSGLLDADFWQAMRQEEETAPVIEIPEEKPQRELIQKVVYPPREKREMTKFQKITFAACAAMLLFLVYLRYAPPMPYSMEVATLVDQMDVQWGVSGVRFEDGRRLSANDHTFDLKKGFLSIAYDQGVEVVVEGPAMFTIERSGVFLDYGRIYSRVSETGTGFTVNTPTARFVDMGTEFGVQANIDGSCELHVTRGRVQLFAGANGQSKITQMVTENEAVQYSNKSGRVEAIQVDRKAFVRRFNSQNKVVWRGTPISLASIIAGGNGADMLNGVAGIDPATGQRVSGYRKLKQKTTGKFAPAADNPWVDGVFIPDGGVGENIISSADHIFLDCPDTWGDGTNSTGTTTHDILAFCNFKQSEIGLSENQLPIFDGILKGTAETPAVLMHSNVGITFDLEAIRSVFPDAAINQFASSFGLPNKGFMKGAKADVWILIDGQTRFVHRDLVQDDGALTMAVDIASQDRYLTIAVTDAAPQTAGVKKGFTFDMDFVYLLSPQLRIADTLGSP